MAADGKMELTFWSDKLRFYYVFFLRRLNK